MRVQFLEILYYQASFMQMQVQVGVLPELIFKQVMLKRLLREDGVQ